MCLDKNHKKTIRQRISNYRAYDLKRFGTNEGSITYDEYIELVFEQKGKCYWTGVDMTVNDGLPSDVSLDRLDCALPHTKENCVLTTRACNLGRNDASLLEWATYLNMLGILAEEHVADLKQAGLI